MPACIDDSSTFLFTTVAVSNFLPYMFIWLNPHASLMTVVITFDIAVATEALIVSNVPHVNYSDIASSMGILFGLALIIYSVLWVSVTVGFVFTVIGVFGSAAVVSKDEIRSVFESAFNIDIGDVAYWFVIVAFIALLLTAYYYASKSRILAWLTQSVIYSFTSTVAIYWLWYAIGNHYTVCFHEPDWGWAP
jgi:hypothetical protein